MRHHIKILTDEYELNVLDKVVNKNSELYNNEIKESNNKTKDESTITSSSKAKATPVGQLNIRKTEDNKIAVIHKGLKVLYDSGSSHTMVNSKWTKHCKHLQTHTREQEFHMAAGT